MRYLKSFVSDFIQLSLSLQIIFKVGVAFKLISHLKESSSLTVTSGKNSDDSRCAICAIWVSVRRPLKTWFQTKFVKCWTKLRKLPRPIRPESSTTKEFSTFRSLTSSGPSLAVRDPFWWSRLYADAADFGCHLPEWSLRFVPSSPFHDSCCGCFLFWDKFSAPATTCLSNWRYLLILKKVNQLGTTLLWLSILSCTGEQLRSNLAQLTSTQMKSGF